MRAPDCVWASDSCSRGHTTQKAEANLENTWTSGAQSQTLNSQLRMLLNSFITPFSDIFVLIFHRLKFKIFLKYSFHNVKFTLLKHTIQWFLI